MKTEKTKITAQIFSVIKGVAEALPPMAKYRGGQPVYKPTQVQGSKLRQEDLKAGTPLVANALYTINVLQYENHEENLVRGVKERGITYIEDYRTAVMAQQNAFIKQHAKENTALERIKRVLNNINPWKKTN